jgi:hypothetical protein
MSVSNRALQVVADALRQRRSAMGSRGRRLPAGRQALLVLAHLTKGETYTALAGGFGVGTTTVFRYVREGVDVLAAVAPTLEEALDVARRKAFVILDGTLLSIDRVGMVSGYDRGFYSGKHKRHGLNVQVIADPAGRLVWASPALPGARHDLGAAREHGLIDGLTATGPGSWPTPPTRAPVRRSGSRSVGVGSRTLAMDLADSSDRTLAESAALVAARMAGETLLNVVKAGVGQVAL